MKSPEEIKKGLECCSNVNFVCNEECPYYKSLSEGEDCCLKKDADALALIQQLQAENAEQAERIRVLEAERDAAVEALKNGDVCESCKHFGTLMDEEPCAWCGRLHSNFEWRGVQKEE